MSAALNRSAARTKRGFQMTIQHRMAASLAALTLAACASAQFYSENFEVDNTANWQVNAVNAGNVADFFFDYSTVGIPCRAQRNRHSRLEVGSKYSWQRRF